jgi:hypothetical protein
LCLLAFQRHSFAFQQRLSYCFLVQNHNRLQIYYFFYYYSMQNLKMLHV